MPHIKNALLRYRVIDKCIRNKYKPFPSKQDLREACEEALFGSIHGEHICDSTIEKDMFAMKMDHDAPIKYNRAYKGYYYEDPEFTIDDIPLTENDKSAIAFAAKTLMQFKNVDMFRQFGSAIDKIVDRINVSEDDDAAQFIQFEQALSTGGNEFLAPLLEAIKNAVWVKFDYASYQTNISKLRCVAPLLLKEYRNRWYLISFDPDKSNYITYALDRIQNLQITKDLSERPADFDADNFFKHSIGITSGQQLPDIVVFEADDIGSKYLVSQPLHHSQEIQKEAKGKTVFSMKASITEELIREFMSYAGQVKVLQPQSLIEILKKRAKAILS